eukprot:354903-Chlamydomonas_euryale.AAC.37
MHPHGLLLLLSAADIGVWAQQDVLQLGLFLVYLFERPALTRLVEGILGIALAQWRLGRCLGRLGLLSSSSSSSSSSSAARQANSLRARASTAFASSQRLGTCAAATSASAAAARAPAERACTHAVCSPASHEPAQRGATPQRTFTATGLGE